MRRLTALVVVVLALVGLVATPVSARPGARPAPPTGIGPWDVGLRTIEVVDADRAGRTLPVDVWYPVDADDAVGVPPAELDLFVTTAELDHALAGPEPSSAGPFPLVVFSHGSGGFRAQSWTFLEALASHGFVVASPDHVGNTALDGFFGTTTPFPVTAANRPRDVSLVIDEVLAPTSPVAGVVDAGRIGVAGHSFGGFTALAVAGGYGSYEPDERVDAVMPVAPATGPLSDAELGEVDVPTFLLSGTLDVTTPIVPNTTRAWSSISTKEAYRSDVLGAGHNSFTNVCDLVDVLVSAGLPPALLASLVASAEEGCAPELIDIERAQEVMILHGVSFFRTTLGPDARYRQYLTPNVERRLDLPVDFSVRRGAPRR